MEIKERIHLLLNTPHLNEIDKVYLDSLIRLDRAVYILRSKVSSCDYWLCSYLIHSLANINNELRTARPELSLEVANRLLTDPAVMSTWEEIMENGKEILSLSFIQDFKCFGEDAVDTLMDADVLTLKSIAARDPEIVKP